MQEELLNQNKPARRINITNTVGPDGQNVKSYSQRGGAAVTTNDTQRQGFDGPKLSEQSYARRVVAKHLNNQSQPDNKISATPTGKRVNYQQQLQQLGTGTPSLLGSSAIVQKSTQPDGVTAFNQLGNIPTPQSPQQNQLRLGQAMLPQPHQGLGKFQGLGQTPGNNRLNETLQNQQVINNNVRSLTNAANLNRLNHLTKIEMMDGRLPASMQKERAALEAQINGNLGATDEQANKQQEQQNQMFKQFNDFMFKRLGFDAQQQQNATSNQRADARLSLDQQRFGLDQERFDFQQNKPQFPPGFNDAIRAGEEAYTTALGGFGENDPETERNSALQRVLSTYQKYLNQGKQTDQQESPLGAFNQHPQMKALNDAGFSQSDIEFTAQQRGMSVDAVIKQLMARQ